MQLSTTERLTHLRSLMLRTDLLPTEKLICWYLLAELTNGETGLCYCSNHHLARTLSLNIRTVERAKNSLRSKSILTWQATGPQTGAASSYRFLQVKPVHRPVPTTPVDRYPPVHRPVGGTGLQTASTKPETHHIPKDDAAAQKRIRDGLRDLVKALKAQGPLQ